MKTNYVFGKTKLFTINKKVINFFLYANLLKVTILLALFLTSSSIFAQMSVTSTEITPVCGDDGEIHLTVTGGTPPYTYTWTNNTPNPSQISNWTLSYSSVTHLGAGSYTINITDQNQNQITYNVILSGVQRMFSTFSRVQPSSCVSTDGSLTANIVGGTAPYTYDWYSYWCPNYNSTCSDPNCGYNYGSGYGHPVMLGQSSSTISGLSADPGDHSGVYLCRITDANGCIHEAGSNGFNYGGDDTLFLVSTLNGQFTNDITALDISCNGQNDGEINLGVTGISYNWTGPGLTSTSQNISNLQPGTYTVEVLTDPQYYHQTVPYCISTATITINEPAPLNVNVMQNGLDLQANVLGGTPNYTYLWNPNGEVTQSITPIVNGIYNVAVTDANGCQEVESFNVTNTTTSINNMRVGNFEVYPNPSTGILNIELNSDDINGIEISIYNLSGELVYSDIKQTIRKVDLSNLPNSVYLLKIATNNTVFNQRVVLQ